MNNSSVIEKLSQDVDTFLKKGQVREAATLVISFLSSNAGDNDAVGVSFNLQLSDLPYYSPHKSYC